MNTRTVSSLRAQRQEPAVTKQSPLRSESRADPAVEASYPAMGGSYGVAQREVMIREAAFFRAEHRAFAPGSELEDWFAAEREIDRLMKSASGQP